MKRMIVGIVFLSLILLPMVSIATDVGGIIYTDTTWNLAGSPYNLISEVQVADGVTLTIEPGVVVNGNGKQFPLWGSLNAIGTSTSIIVINDLTLYYQQSNSVINLQFVLINGGYYYFGSTSPSHFSLKDSKIQNVTYIAINEESSSLDSYIERNVFDNITLGIDVDESKTSQIHITNNVFHQIGAPGLRIWARSTEPVGTIIEYNSFLDTDRVALAAAFYAKVTATNNYWNTTDTNVIDSMIWDRKDDLGIMYYVDYLPFLATPHPDTPIPDFNQMPIADAGADQVVLTSVNLNGGGSYDPDGSIVSHDWSLQYRGNSSYNKTASGVTPAISDLQPGFYDVYLTVTDNLGLKDTDSMLLAVAGEGSTWPSPNANIDVNTFRITNNKRNDRTTTEMSGTINLPDLSIVEGDTVNARITLELFGVLAGGDDLIISENVILNVNETKSKLDLRK